MTSAIHGHEPTWATRGDRSIPKVAVPAVRTVAPELMQNLRPLAVWLIVRPLIAVAGFVVMARAGWWLMTPVVVWFLYGSTLSAVHHLIHGSVGLSPRWRHRWLTILACIVVESGHALLITHAHHHRDGSDAPDPEGYIEYLAWREMPLGALRYRYRLAVWGLRHGNTWRHRITGEMGVHAALHLASLALLPVDATLWIYLSLVHVASFAFAVLQGKGPQANWGRAMTSPLLFVHTRLLAFVFFRHHQHLEHHAYPKVPLTRLAALRPHVEAAVGDADVRHLHLAL